MIKSITVYSNGDSNDISTWSNVPYLFCKALEQKGIKVNRVNIEANRFFKRIFNTFCYYLYRKLLKQNACPEYNRTWMHRYLTERKIDRSNIQFLDSDLNLFLTYTFLNKNSNKPNVLWCDWSDRISIERMGRTPKWYELAGLRYEDKVLANATTVYTMFPACKEKMEQIYGREFRYLDRNVINTVYEGKFNIADNIKTRFFSNKIIFIGNYRYKSAAYELIDAFNHLRKGHPHLTLDIIGMTKSELTNIENFDCITCHGYLNKNDSNQRSFYYKLLHKATVLVNPSRQWGAYSSTIEAMFYGCPVIVSPYDDFVKEFGSNINFGIYITDQKSTMNCIEEILNVQYENYSRMSLCAHNVVSEYTWDNYISSFLADLNNVGIS